MPLAKRVVKLVQLNRERVPPDKSCQPPPDSDSSCHSALVDVLRLLSSLVVKADEVFGDIAQECQTVFNRAQRLSTKVKSVSDKVETLNARAVRVRKYETIDKRVNNDFKVKKCVMFALQSVCSSWASVASRC